MYMHCEQNFCLALSSYYFTYKKFCIAFLLTHFYLLTRSVIYCIIISILRFTKYSQLLTLLYIYDTHFLRPEKMGT